jgi:ATP-dependent exoDNAse (exonuclease V) beta subunit
LRADSGYGLRRDDLISKDGDPGAVAARMSAYEQWQTERATTVRRAGTPSLAIQTVTDLAADRHQADVMEPVEIEVVDLSPASGRPFGPAFGTLVHATLATVPLDANEAVVSTIAATQGRILLGVDRVPDEEIYAAAEVVMAVLRHPLFDRVRAAARAGRCHREWPVVWQSPHGTLVEGTIDLAFEDADGLTVLDFKTDRELATDLDRYRRQLTIYCRALEAVRGVRPRGVLMRV